jgi:nucleoside phosphorylase
MDKRRKFKLIGTGADSEDDEPGLVKRPRTSLATESQGLPESHDGLPASSYTIAWICAIPCELAAARAMLDETHSSLSDQPQHDSNHYTLGAIGRHNVVIACLPVSQYGTINATNVLTNLTRTFPSVRACLMVGVGGGVPSQMNDIRLGDVVVGVRVMPYELGKVGTGGEVQHTGSCLMPHPSLSTLLSTVRAKHEAEPSRVPSILRDTFSSYPGYTHPGLPDNLFDASYDHVPSKMEGPCSDCDTLRLVPRRTRRSMDPRIHYGAIGSGDKLMKDGTTRDQLARKLDVMCFEMEAAGLMGVLPCLPIRGICDYSDSHKNKDWQRYAAAAAAAYARELMEVMPVMTRDGLRERPVREGTIINGKFLFHHLYICR